MHENEVLRSAVVKGLKLDDGELELINRQSLKTLTAEDVYVFKVAACNNQVDRDFEKFSDAVLSDMAAIYPGKTMVYDHNWSASKQTARIYAASVETMEGVVGGKQLVLRVYMLKTESTADVIAQIEGGILREVSVGARCDSAICGICGADKRKVFCEHRRGAVYDGTTCIVQLDKASDVYEVSFVAVPAQPAAGVTKTYGGEEVPPADDAKNGSAELERKLRLRRAKIKMLKIETEE
ncbi:MAG: hypothetical protein CVU91_13390 [Firmicutes bacterium HGW-Firmicutes-16]|nr:MAG: hypothetical protein CVU91_13390 [Firmicutes bacterium HGW-Firmicutes-16]